MAEHREPWLERFDRKEFGGIQEANASFKGVPFLIESSEATFGRRLITHEYPLKDEPYTEDLGRKVRIFSISGAILGGDYLTVRDQLVAICENGAE